MAENGYVTTREFQAAINRIDSKLDNLDSKFTEHIAAHVKLSTEFASLKEHFNDSLDETVKQKVQNFQYNLDLKRGVILSFITGGIGFASAYMVR